MIPFRASFWLTTNSATCEVRKALGAGETIFPGRKERHPQEEVGPHGEWPARRETAAAFALRYEGVGQAPIFGNVLFRMVESIAS